jgi:(1->4)-alpha-D-glucan 1-alpha-D-glucosylmutase
LAPAFEGEESLLESRCEAPGRNFESRPTMKPRATYRMQLHKGFAFQDAARQADYLSSLGISHVYTSPILAARAGSKHGYDVIDHSRINPELGGESGFRELATALKARDIGLIVDIVPNHMAVGKADNSWWLDLLRCGPASAYAKTFDIDWDSPGFEGKVVAPFLDGAPKDLIERGTLRLEIAGGVWAFGYFDHRFPLRDQDQDTDWSAASHADLRDLLQHQHFALLNWRDADAKINWRRFFDITDLAAIRVAEPEVFQAVHQKIFSLYAEGLVAGVRIDHIDGLADPNSYCRQLRACLEEMRTGAYIVVEKILADGEELPDWHTDGTTGYDAMNELSAFLHKDDQGALEASWQRYSGRGRSFEEEEVEARAEMLRTKFEAQFAATCRAFEKLLPGEPVNIALGQIIIHLRCYRSYATGRSDSPGPGAALETAMQKVGVINPDLKPTLTFIYKLFCSVADDSLVVDALRRFHQLSAPIAAKAVEDTAFYRYGRLLSRNDVGFDPRRHTLRADAFHHRMGSRISCFPDAMITVATHDHKRGADARARLAAISHHVQAWLDFVEYFEPPKVVDAADFYFLLQTLVGAWPSTQVDEAFVERISHWCEKYLREAKLRSSWTSPAVDYEDAFKALARELCLGDNGRAFRSQLSLLLQTIEPQAKANMLIQTILEYTLPGVPDLYQGGEFLDLSLVDPDNRSPVDYAARQAALANHGSMKQEIIAALLSLRKGDPNLWRLGSYEPFPIQSDGDDLLGFRRTNAQSTLLTIICRTALCRHADTVTLDGQYSDVLTGDLHGPGETPLRGILGGRAAAVLYAFRS